MNTRQTSSPAGSASAFGFRRRRTRTGIGSALAASALVLSACGGSDDADPATTVSTATEATVDGTATDNGEVAPPDATLPELPDEAKEGFRPIEFSGRQLPAFPGNAEPDPADGTPAPTFTGYDIQDQVVRVDPAEQGKTMIIMVSHWCPVCNKEVPEIVQLSETGQIPADLNVVAVLAGSDPTQSGWPPGEWIQQIGWPYLAVFDGLTNALVNGQQRVIGLANAYYGFSSVPSVVLVDADGNVADRWSGGLGKDAIAKRIQDSLYADS